MLEFRSAGKVQRSKDSTGQLLLITRSLETENGTERKVREPSWHTEQRWDVGFPPLPFVGGGTLCFHLHWQRERNAAPIL